MLLRAFGLTTSGVNRNLAAHSESASLSSASMAGAVTMRSWVKPAMVVLPMTDVYLAPELLESRRVFGKLVLTP